MAFRRDLGPAGRHALLGFAGAALVTIAVGIYVPSAVRGQVIAVEGRWLQAATAALEQSLPSLAGRTELSELEHAQVEKVLNQRLLATDHDRVKLWTLDGVVLHSSTRALIGERFPTAVSRLTEAATTGLFSDITDPEGPGHVGDAGGAWLVDVYVPVNDPDTGRPAAVLESHQNGSDLATALSTVSLISRISMVVALVALIAFLVLWLRMMRGPVAARRGDGEHHIAERPEGQFTIENEGLLRSAASGPDVAVANVQHHDGLREAADELRNLLRQVTMAHEGERRRIVGELHDTLASRLLRAIYAVRRTASAPTLPEHMRADLAALENIIADAECHLREVMGRVLPATIDSLGLAAALEELVVLVARESDLDVALDLRGELERLPDAAALTLLRAAEEAVLNVRKHASATHVRITAVDRRHAVMLMVEDDGIGWRGGQATPAGHGLGLAYLLERVAGLSGQVRMGRACLGGAMVIVRIPVA